MPVQLDTGSGSQPAARPHAATEVPAYTSTQDPGLGSTPIVRPDGFNADADPTRLIVGWNEGGGTVAGYQTWTPILPTFSFFLTITERVSVTETITTPTIA